MSVNTLSNDLLQQLGASGLSTGSSSTASSSKKPKELRVDTSKFAGCNLQEFTLMVQEGLEGSDKEFYQRLQKRGIEKVFNAFDDGDGTLNLSEARSVSSIGYNQMNRGSSGKTGLSALLSKLGNINLPNVNLSSAIASLYTPSGTSTGSAVSVAGGGATGAINFAMQFNGKSAAEMSGPMSATGFHSGAWCADFVYYALKNAGTVPAGYDSINHAYCPSIAQWARQNGRAFSDPSQAKPGDLLIMNSEGHIGIVTKVDSQGIHTIEGNTSNAGGAYDGPGGGGYVSTKVRDFGCVSTFVRI